MVAITQVLAVVFLVFFMLASGDLFKRKLVRIFGDTLSEKKITVQTIDEIDTQIRRYLGVVRGEQPAGGLRHLDRVPHGGRGLCRALGGGGRR